MRVCYFSALRISEALKSKREDYQNEDKYFFLVLREQKTDKKDWEKQPIKPFIFGEVQRYCNDNNIRSQDFVFQSNRNQQLRYNTAYKLVKKWAKRAGIDKSITTHSFRRSRATHLLDKGMDLYVVSDFLRHKTIETTIKYLKLSKKRLYHKMEEIDKKPI